MSRGLLLLVAAIPAFGQATYSHDVARIFQSKCEICHRPNDIAPFSLQGYEQASRFAEDIKRVVSERIMPPWKPVDGHGSFKDGFGLTQEERDMIVRWVDDGAVKGEDADLPEPLPERGEWSLGEPDLVLGMTEEYTPPRGKDMYRCFVLPTDFERRRFVSAADVLPGDRSIVHHVILFLDTSGKAEELDAAEEGPGYTCFGGPGTVVAAGSAISSILANGMALGGWAPGARARLLPEKIGMELPAKARVVMQVHYYARSRTAADKTRVGLYFTKGDVERRLIYVPLVPLDVFGRVALTIPAGAEAHEARGVLPVIAPLQHKIITIFPHMHLLGRKIEVEATIRGEDVPLIKIDDWDFNWQGQYTFTEPIEVPGFSLLKVKCTYNNSESNPRNPNNPVKTVTWGEGTEDEMCLAFLGVTFDNENLLFGLGGVF